MRLPHYVDVLEVVYPPHRAIHIMRYGFGLMAPVRPAELRNAFKTKAEQMQKALRLSPKLEKQIDLKYTLLRRELLFIFQYAELPGIFHQQPLDLKKRFPDYTLDGRPLSILGLGLSPLLMPVICKKCKGEGFHSRVYCGHCNDHGYCSPCNNCRLWTNGWSKCPSCKGKRVKELPSTEDIYYGRFYPCPVCEASEQILQQWLVAQYLTCDECDGHGYVPVEIPAVKEVQGA